LAAWLVNGIWLACFCCPACGSRFFMWSNSPLSVGNVWAARCHHCGARPPEEQ
jgi:DNA-directed RNA polymerase subunit RPC12/RpoP